VEGNYGTPSLDYEEGEKEEQKEDGRRRTH
jgi:hypothetical protein